MNTTSIEWVKNPDGSQGYTHNPMSGCLYHTPEGLCLGGMFPCYAYKLAHGRLKERYLVNTNLASGAQGGVTKLVIGDASVVNRAEDYDDPFYPRLWEDRLKEIKPYPFCNTNWKPDKPKGVFVCDMSDLFGIGIPEAWTRQVLEQIERSPHYRFYLLTKQPQNLIEFSPFPDNAWVGVTATNTEMLLNAVNCFETIEAKVKYISIEPLLGWADTSKWVYPLVDSLKGLDWLIIGACTGTFYEMSILRESYPDLSIKVADEREGQQLSNRRCSAQPNIEWVREIVEAADKAGIPVFLKDNLDPLIYGQARCFNLWTDETSWQLRQELPK